MKTLLTQEEVAGALTPEQFNNNIKVNQAEMKCFYSISEYYRLKSLFGLLELEDYVEMALDEEAKQIVVRVWSKEE